MDEATWQTTDNYTRMMDWLGPRMSKRKRFLFGCATAQMVWDRLTWECNRQAIEITEQHADGLATRKELAAAYQNLIWEPVMYTEWHIMALTDGLPDLRPSTDPPHQLHEQPRKRTRSGVMRRRWADAVRDLVHNPFHPLTIGRAAAAWSAYYDGAAVKLAQVIYQERRWQDLPILADALEEAGCPAGELLDHCRHQREHFRGCWAVDLLLGRERVSE
jgi:hypothetical protein